MSEESYNVTQVIFDNCQPKTHGRRSSTALRATFTAVTASVLFLTLTACGSDDGQLATSTTTTLTGVSMVKPQITTPPPTTTAATRTTTTTQPVETETETVEPVETTPATDDYDMDSSTNLETAIAQSGNYTEDEILSMTVYLAFACDMKDAPELAGFWTPANIATDITDNYGFTITPQTARILYNGCDDQ